VSIDSKIRHQHLELARSGAENEALRATRDHSVPFRSCTWRQRLAIEGRDPPAAIPVEDPLFPRRRQNENMPGIQGQGDARTARGIDGRRPTDIVGNERPRRFGDDPPTSHHDAEQTLDLHHTRGVPHAAPARRLRPRPQDRRRRPPWPRRHPRVHLGDARSSGDALRGFSVDPGPDALGCVARTRCTFRIANPSLQAPVAGPDGSMICARSPSLGPDDAARRWLVPDSTGGSTSTRGPRYVSPSRVPPQLRGGGNPHLTPRGASGATRPSPIQDAPCQSASTKAAFPPLAVRIELGLMDTRQ
jgi:hypothetical protein